MIIKVNTLTHKVIHSVPETYVLLNLSDGFVQVKEDGILQFSTGDIRTYVLGPNISRDYEDPRTPEKNIHAISIDISDDICTIIDNGKTMTLHKNDGMFDI